MPAKAYALKMHTATAVRFSRDNFTIAESSLPKCSKDFIK